MSVPLIRHSHEADSIRFQELISPLEATCGQNRSYLLIWQYYGKIEGLPKYKLSYVKYDDQQLQY